MNKKPDVKEIITKNPSVDPEKLQQGLDAIQELKKTGVVQQSTYSLEMPTTGKPHGRTVVVSRKKTSAGRLSGYHLGQ
jgi:hypothetical protein